MGLLDIAGIFFLAVLLAWITASAEIADVFWPHNPPRYARLVTIVGIPLATLTVVVAFGLLAEAGYGRF